MNILAKVPRLRIYRSLSLCSKRMEQYRLVSSDCHHGEDGDNDEDGDSDDDDDVGGHDGIDDHYEDVNDSYTDAT